MKRHAAMPAKPRPNDMKDAMRKAVEKLTEKAKPRGRKKPRTP